MRYQIKCKIPTGSSEKMKEDEGYIIDVGNKLFAVGDAVAECLHNDMGIPFAPGVVVTIERVE